MSIYFLLAILMFPAILIGMLLMKVLRGGRKMFPKSTKWYCLVAALCFGLLGLTGFLAKTWLIENIQWLLAALFLGLGLVHRYSIYSANPWAEAESFWRETMFTFLLMILGGVVFLFAFHWSETRSLKGDIRWADNVVWAVLFFPLPFFLFKTWEFWLAIPAPARRIKVAWQPPFGTQPMMIEPGPRSIILHFHIPVRSASMDDIIQVNIRTPVEKTVGELFYYLLYRQNVERNTQNKTRIEISEGNNRERVFGWLFYQKSRRRWWQWWDNRLFLNAEQAIRNQPLKNGDVIFTDRVVVW